MRCSRRSPDIPGTPMALAPVAYSLWQQFLRYRPRRSGMAQSRPLRAVERPRLDAAVSPCCTWPGARRSIRSTKRLGELGGHARRHQAVSASWTAGLPDIPNIAGLRASRPPRGRWARVSANSVGMAIAGKWLAAHFNRPGFEMFDYNVYAMCGDGDMMEGVASEAASLAGH